MPPRDRDRTDPGRSSAVADDRSEIDRRGRAIAGVVERDIRAGLAVERPSMTLPRARTPADEALAVAIAELRRQSPEWHVAEQVASAIGAMREIVEAQNGEILALSAQVATLAEGHGEVARVHAVVGKSVARIRKLAGGAAFAAISSIIAVIYGAGVKSGHQDTEQVAGREQAAAVKTHEARLNANDVRDGRQDERLDAVIGRRRRDDDEPRITP